VPPHRATPPRRPIPPLASERVDELRSRLLDWHAANRRDLPWRHTRDPYAVLVSEIMLQQTQVPRVIPKYLEFVRTYATLEALADGPLAEVLRLWRGLGYNNRAERLWRCARASVAQRPPGGPASLPATLEGLVALPGIGPYTARAVLIFSHNADVAAVDANVRRVLTRELELPTDLSPAALQAVADAVLPPGHSRDWHNALMDYGSLVLTARITGISPRTRQGAFEGSRRWYRSRLLQALLDDGPQEVVTLARLLDTDPGFIDELARALERDGLVLRQEDRVAVA